ncbi:MAG: hypothetical protein JSU68_11000 [Phycisphaerales bacterium]|nr:MAG: hypothetical protein JSU68_11000 [Phycisphaerales bacterium]
MTHKLSWICALGLFSAWGCRLGGPYAPDLQDIAPRDLRGAPAPQPTPDEMRTLTDVVRRALATKRTAWPSRIARRLSPELAQQKCRAYVTVCDRGVVVAEGASRYLPLPEAFAEATRTAMSAIAPKRDSFGGGCERLSVECELTGPAEYVPFAGSDRLRFEHYFEPGIHGYGLLHGLNWHELRPSQVISVGWGSLGDPTLPVVAELLADEARAGGSTDVARAYRFRSTHWWQPQATWSPVPLLRGLIPATDEDVDADRLDLLIQRVGDYLLDRQQVEGLFSYEYLIGPELFSDDNNWVRQAGATYGLAQYAAYTDFGDVKEACLRATAAWVRSITPLAGIVGAGFIDTDDGENKLGTTALVLLALNTGSSPDRYNAERDLLTNAILTIQQDDGRFLTNFPPADHTGTQYYYPGEALLALAHEYRLTRDQRIAAAFHKAHGYYRAFFQQDRNAAFVPWQVQAHALMHTLTGQAEYADFAFEMSDWLARKQIRYEHTIWPDLVGGFATKGPGFATISTASYLEGFASALDLARRVGDAERAQHYEQVVRAAARFVMQLIVKPEEAFFHQRPDQTLWGVRTFLTDTRLRIDHVQHALVSLIQTRKALFGDPPDS